MHMGKTAMAPVAKRIMPNVVQSHGGAKQGMPKSPVTVPDATTKAYDNGVAVRDYVTAKGYGGAVDWDGKNPTIGGKAVPMLRNQNGTAYVDKSVADQAINAYEQRAGITGNNGVVNNFNSEYKGAINDALDRVTERDPYSWDSGRDEAFQKYKDYYSNQANEAMRKVLEENNTSYAGASGAVMSQAMAARDNYLDNINAEYKDFEQRQYDRYMDDYNMRRNDLNDIVGVANDVYNKEYQSNRDSIGDSVTALRDEREEKWRQTEYNDNERFRNIEYEQAIENVIGSRIGNEGAVLDHEARGLQNIGLGLDNEGAAIRNRGAELDNEGAVIRNRGYELDNEAKGLQNIGLGLQNINLELQNEGARLGIDNQKFDMAIRMASERGEFIESDEALIPWLSRYRNGNGGYTFKPGDYEKLYEEGMAYATAAGQYKAAKEYGVLMGVGV